MSKSLLVEMEYRQLESAVADVQRLMASGQGNAMLSTFIDNAKKRLDVLDTEIKSLDAEKKQNETALTTAAAAAAERETALNTQEKEIFSGFFKKEFFTKADFGSLEDFYRKSYDRLSDEGKEAMSHRVWEGIRHQEYEFSDLPEIVKEKESKALYTSLSKRRIGGDNLDQIPEADKNDFIRAYESRQKDEIYKILNRDSFKQNVSLASSKELNSANASKDKGGQASALLKTEVEERTTSQQKVSANVPAAAKEKIDAMNLDGLTLADAGALNVANMPGGGGKVHSR